MARMPRKSWQRMNQREVEMDTAISCRVQGSGSNGRSNAE